MNRNGALAKRLAQTYHIEPGKELTRNDLHVVAFKMAMIKDEEARGVVVDILNWLCGMGFIREDLIKFAEPKIDRFLADREGGEE